MNDGTLWEREHLRSGDPAELNLVALGSLRMLNQEHNFDIRQFLAYNRLTDIIRSLTYRPQLETGHFLIDPVKLYLIDSAAGYQITNTDEPHPLWIRWSERFSENINRYSLWDGSWAVDVERSENDPDRYLLYWLYPFDAHLHVWQINKCGERVGCFDPPEDEKLQFFAKRRHVSAAFLIRFYMTSFSRGDFKTCNSIKMAVVSAARSGFIDAIYCILHQPDLFSKEDVSNSVALAILALTAFCHSVVPSEERNIQRITLEKLANVLNNHDLENYNLSSISIQKMLDYCEAFGDIRYVKVGPRMNSSDVCVHEDILDSEYMGMNFHGQSIAIVGKKTLSALEFHFLKSTNGMRERVMSGAAYANYLFSICEQGGIGQFGSPAGAGDWILDFEVGDLPCRNNCVAFERNLNDRGVALIPDLYYFQSRGFRNGWINGAVPPWESKTSVFTWRGSTTGGHDHTVDNIIRLPRFRLCSIGREIGPAADLGISRLVFERSEQDSQEILSYLKSIELWKKHIPQHVMGRSKYLLEIDGNSNSWGFLAKLLMGCCVLKVDSPYEQWFYSEIEPWVHYIPVAQDLSNLLEMMEWCLMNEATCRNVALAGRALAEELTFDKEMEKAAATMVSMVRPLN